jgi:hypothetical protein
LEVPLLLVSNNFPNEYQNPQPKQHKIIKIELVFVCFSDWRGKPKNKNYLVVSGKKEIEKLNHDPMFSPTDVLPSIIFSTFLKASLAKEVVSQSRSPSQGKAEDYPLPS